MTPAITDVPGILVGHATDAPGGTGCTVVLAPPDGMPCTAFVRGRATGSRELDACRPESLAGRVDAVVLTGGSAYGLAAADGVMRWLEARGRGFKVGSGVVPIVPAAVVFDLLPFGRFDARPTAETGTACCDAAGTSVAEGSVGAGTGATVGKALGLEWAMKGGVGSWSASAGDVVVGALAVVNAFGDVLDASGRVLAGARRSGGGFAGSAEYLSRGGLPGGALRAAHHTTLVVVATNVALDRLALGGVARAGADALARRVVPSGTALDGDVVFACSVGAVAAPAFQVEQLARAATETAVERAVRAAQGRDGIPGLGDGAGAGAG
ncbi:MAG TPA: P1 family peptidase [Gemmatimonadales bacterium]|nr:P1 family peptidase [Gemmatimonadales bacterium]